MPGKSLCLRTILPLLLGFIVTSVVCQPDKNQSMQNASSTGLPDMPIFAKSHIFHIDAQAAFNGLDSRSQNYAYYLSQAQREATRLIYFQ